MKYKLKHFSDNEFEGNIDKMCGYTLLSIDMLRDYVNFPFVLHSSFAVSGHAKNSYHYRGLAVDFHVKYISFYDAYHKIIEALDKLQIKNYCGFGVYFDWVNCGFHFDTRGERARWGRDMLMVSGTGYFGWELVEEAMKEKTIEKQREIIREKIINDSYS